MRHNGVPQLTAYQYREAFGPEVIPIPLGSLREVDSNDIPAVTDTPKSDDPSGFAGLLGKDTTPILEFTSGDSDSSIRLNYASSDSDPVAFQVPLANIDPEEDIEIYFRAGVHGNTDTPKVSADIFFNEGDTKVEADSGEISGDVDADGLSAMAEYSITVAASDIPDGAETLTAELTLGSHTTDAVFISALWVEYWREINYRV